MASNSPTKPDYQKKMEELKMKATQIAQRRMLTLLDRSRVRDRRSIGDMLERVDVLSINQTTALIKLLEAWKANKHQDYPVCLKKGRKIEGEEPARSMCAYKREEMVEDKTSRE